MSTHFFEQQPMRLLDTAPTVILVPRKEAEEALGETIEGEVQ